MPNGPPLPLSAQIKGCFTVSSHSFFMFICGGQRSMSGVLLGQLPFILRWGLLLNLELFPFLIKLTGQRPLGVFSLPSHPGIANAFRCSHLFHALQTHLVISTALIPSETGSFFIASLSWNSPFTFLSLPVPGLEVCVIHPRQLPSPESALVLF